MVPEKLVVTFKPGKEMEERVRELGPKLKRHARRSRFLIRSAFPNPRPLAAILSGSLRDLPSEASPSD